MNIVNACMCVAVAQLGIGLSVVSPEKQSEPTRPHYRIEKKYLARDGVRNQDSCEASDRVRCSSYSSVYSAGFADTRSSFSLDGWWDVVNSNGSVRMNGSVPGNVHTALQQSGIIGDPYYRFNDDDYRWIVRDSWTYSRSFLLDAHNLEGNLVRLVCRGIDTVARIRVNGMEVGSTDNQFVEYVFDVTPAVKNGENFIEVSFQSAVEYTQEEFDSHDYLVPPICPPDEYHPECHANFIRKAQCSFSWDWGPAFPTQGIWKSIALEFFQQLSVRSVTSLPYKDDSGWQLNVTVYFDLAPSDRGIDGQLTARIPELSGAERSVDITVSATSASATVIIPATQAKSWWPRGYGAAKLYDLLIDFIPHRSPASSIHAQDRTGFRTIELVEESISSGRSFFFKINGVPIFMKGSNWIPMDSFLDRVSYDRLSHLLLSAVEANMNSIRIWGGGVYESDQFYDMADQLGILVWQDMMFACSMYPVHAKFLATVRNEMRHQVRRLGSHPSVMAWTANNENEGALVDNWYGTAGALYDVYKSDYIKLYIDTVRQEILSNDVTRPFLSSSPSNWKTSEGDVWISESPGPSAPQYGDVHYYNYQDDCLDFTILPETRYSSEYGFQSWPSYHTLKKVALPEDDLFYGSPFFHHREHHSGAGNGTENIIRRHFNWPNTDDKYEDFKSYIFLTQVAQAVCYQSQTEFYRRSQSVESIATMGALYWQHNDIWQAPSWSTIDYDGRWKMAHYFAARFFSDPMVSLVEIGTSSPVVSVYAVNDANSMKDPVDAILTLEMWTWSSQQSLYTWTKDVTMVNGSVKVFEKSRSDLMVESGCTDPAGCFLLAWLRTPDGNSGLGPSNAYYFTSWKDATGMSDPNIQVTSISKTDPTTFVVSLSSSAVSAFTWIETGDILGRFSDNGFLMVEPNRRLDFYSLQEGVEANDLMANITITTLFNIYN